MRYRAPALAVISSNWSRLRRWQMCKIRTIEMFLELRYDVILSYCYTVNSWSATSWWKSIDTSFHLLPRVTSHESIVKLLPFPRKYLCLIAHISVQRRGSKRQFVAYFPPKAALPVELLGCSPSSLKMGAKSTHILAVNIIMSKPKKQHMIIVYSGLHFVSDLSLSALDVQP